MTKDACSDSACDDPFDRATFELDEEQTTAFMKALAKPPAPTMALRDLMSRPFPWEVDKP
jgi:uncharacterized protein (DUF1778 family)